MLCAAFKPESCGDERSPGDPASRGASHPPPGPTVGGRSYGIRRITLRCYYETTEPVLAIVCWVLLAAMIIAYGVVRIAPSLQRTLSGFDSSTRDATPDRALTGR